MKLDSTRLHFFSKRGSTILIVLALLAMLTSLAIMSVNRSNTDMELSYNQLHEENAFYAADAGLTASLVELKEAPYWRGPVKEEPIGSYKYSLAFRDSLIDSALIDTVVVTSTSTREGSNAEVEGWIIPEYYKPFIFGAYGEDSVKLYNHACTDSYNSDSGAYILTQSNTEGNIGSNGEIELSNISTVNGNASTSDTGSITLNKPSKVNGDTTSTAPVYDNSTVSDSEFTWAQANSIAPSGFSGGYNYNSSTGNLSLNTHDTLTLASGIYYLSSITLGNQAVVKLAPGAKVTIFMTGDLRLNQFSKMNEGGVPSDFIVYSQGSSFTMGQNTTFVGAFWGENTNISLEQSVNVFGAIAGKSNYIANYSCVHFDRSLLKFKTKRIKDMHMIAWRQK